MKVTRWTGRLDKLVASIAPDADYEHDPGVNILCVSVVSPQDSDIGKEYEGIGRIHEQEGLIFLPPF